MVAYFSPPVRSSRKRLMRSMRMPQAAGWADRSSAPCSSEASSAELTPLPETSATTADQQLRHLR